MTDWSTVPPWKSRAAPEARLAIPDATAAICSARSAGSCSLAAMGSPSAETRMACDTPGVSVANLATSQSYSPLGWAMASVVNIGFLSVCSVLCIGACGAHTVLVAVQVAADGLRVAARPGGADRGRDGCCRRRVHGAGDEVASGPPHGQARRALLHGLLLLDARCRGPGRVGLGRRPVVGGGLGGPVGEPVGHHRPEDRGVVEASCGRLLRL